MKSLNKYINEVSSGLLARAHNEQVRRNNRVESNRSRKFAKGAHAALDREMSLDDSVSGTERLYDYVDLGLPSGTMWATCNVGATKPEDPGLLFQFGRVDGYRCGDRSNKFRMDDQNKQDTANENIPLTASGKLYKHRINDTLDLEDDAAHVNMGGAWRMPTKDELKELVDNTTHKVETINKVKGMLFTSDINGNQIFIPFGGGWVDDGYFGERFSTNMWSSNVTSGFTSYKYAYSLVCGEDGYADINNIYRSAACSVRGVFKK